MMKKVKVVNDCAEGAIKLRQEYIIINKNEDQKKYLI